MSQIPEQEKLKSILLDYYHCTFFFPVITDRQCPSPSTPDDTYKQTYSSNLKSEDAQAFYFFTPILRTILFDQVDADGNPLQKNLQPMKEWRLPDSLIADWSLKLHKCEKDTRPVGALNQQEAQIESVTLYRYFNDHYMLSVRVSPKALTPALQKRLVDCNAQYLSDIPQDNETDKAFYTAVEKLQLEAWLRFTRLARILYPSFMEQDEEHKIAKLELLPAGIEAFNGDVTNNTQLILPEHTGKDVSPIVKHLFLQFFTENKHTAIEDWLDTQLKLYDDRIFISVAYGLAGAQHSNLTLSRINALTATTDRVEDVFTAFNHYPYSPQALEHYLKDKRFELWRDVGATYTFTDVVNAYVSCGWNFRNIVAPKNIPYIYDRMLVQALFYQATLRHFDQRITYDTQKLLDKTQEKAGLEAIKQHREDFIRFTNQYWFKELTQQMQGKMIGSLQQQGLELDTHYQQLLEEVERTDEYLQTAQEIRSTNTANLWTKIGGIFAVVALYLGMLPIINDFFKDNSQPETSAWQYLHATLKSCCVSDQYAEWVLVAIFLVLIPVTLAVFIGWILDREND